MTIKSLSDKLFWVKKTTLTFTSSYRGNAVSLKHILLKYKQFSIKTAFYTKRKIINKWGFPIVEIYLLKSNNLTLTFF